LSIGDRDKDEGERGMMGLKESVFQIGSVTILNQLQVCNAQASLMVYEWDGK